MERQDAASSSNGIRFDVVLTDVQMPQENGFAFATRIQAEDSSARFLFMSGSTQEVNVFDDVKEGLEESEWRVLQKPLEAQELAEAIEELCCSGA
ncbi:MAG: response regulator [Deltaproteobacteria bacterium]|nr:response regulator [Deltaproteobacteria bacterium]